MGRTIDADRLMGWFKEHNPFDEFPAEYICTIINEQPTVQPQRTRGYERVVYCGECAHMMPDGRCREFADDNIRPSASDYCSAGEKRADMRGEQNG